MGSLPLGKTFAAIAVAATALFLANCSDSPTESGGNPFPQIDVTDTGNQADYVMIVPETLAPGLPALAAHREDQGLHVAVVTLEQIAAGFPDAPSVEEGIRVFISFAAQNWSEPHLQYVLLAGDTDLIPTFFFPSDLAPYGETEVAIDDPYSTILGDDDDYPDIALGRFPASNLKELRTMVQKTIDYERTGESLYQTTSLIVADFSQSGLGLFFEGVAEEFAGSFPENAVLREIDIREDSPDYGTREDLFSEIAKGARVMAYFGRGGETLWSESRILTVDDVPDLPGNRAPSFVLCLTASQKFHDFGAKTLIRELILHESGGSVASLAPSGLTTTLGGSAFLETFWNGVMNLPVGQAVLAAKRAHEAGKDGDFAGQPSRFTLLGDPALRLGL